MFISTGAGYAPFYAMSLAKQFTPASKGGLFGDIDLVFGCRNADEDYIYKREVREWKQSGLYRNVYEAFSRQSVCRPLQQTQKLYVQNVLEQNLENLISHIYERNGSIYICGNNGMTKAVQEVIRKAIGKKTGKDQKGQEEEFKLLLDSKRLCLESWG
jgi:sulfite reductase alpha subunit-like flavoprotein